MADQSTRKSLRVALPRHVHAAGCFGPGCGPGVQPRDHPHDHPYNQWPVRKIRPFKTVENPLPRLHRKASIYAKTIPITTWASHSNAGQPSCLNIGLRDWQYPLLAALFGSHHLNYRKNYRAHQTKDYHSDDFFIHPLLVCLLIWCYAVEIRPVFYWNTAIDNTDLFQRKNLHRRKQTPECLTLGYFASMYRGENLALSKMKVWFFQFHPANSDGYLLAIDQASLRSK
jgi:hypothetical protein